MALALKVVLGVLLWVLIGYAATYLMPTRYIGKTKWNETPNEDEGIQFDEHQWP